MGWRFFRIDSQSGTISSGFNYRTVNYNADLTRRALRKLYGLRVVFTTSGTGGKFSFATLTVTFGAGLAYLGVAAIVTDMVLERFLPHSEMYDRLKNKGDDVIRRTEISLKKSRKNMADEDYHDLEDLSQSTNQSSLVNVNGRQAGIASTMSQR